MTVALIFLIILGVIAAFFVIGFFNLAKHRMHRYGWFLYCWRWLTGSHWDGQPMTNAGWARKGTKALTRSGFAPRFYFLPRWIRTACRTGGSFLPFTIVFGLLANPVLLLRTGTTIAAGCAGIVAWRMATYYKRRTIRKDVLTPLHASIAPMAEMPLSATPSNWIRVTDDRKKAVIRFPPNYHDSEKQREKLVEQAAKKLGMEDPDIRWNFTGKQTVLTLMDGEPPAEEILLADVRDAIENTAQDELILGKGKRGKNVKVSLHIDSPHLGASMRGGAGKSTLARLVAAQALHKGAIVLILDLKRISHPWARGLPNVLYADTVEKVHGALMWLAKELNRRNEVATYSTDVEGTTVASVGPRVLIVAEELNMTTGKLRSYWLDFLQGKGLSPAIMGLQDVAFAGRQVRMNLFMVGQMLSARTTGGGEVRENVGIRILAKYTKRNWEMLVPEFPMPPVNAVLGRVQVVYSGEVHETQVAYLNGAEARDLALSGIVSPLPYDAPQNLVTTLIIPSQPPGEIANTQDDIDNVPTQPITVPMPVTLSDAIRQGLITGTIASVRQARQRDKEFPKPVDRPPEGNPMAHYYDPSELAGWETGRKKQHVHKRLPFPRGPGSGDCHPGFAYARAGSDSGSGHAVREHDHHGRYRRLHGSPHASWHRPGTPLPGLRREASQRPGRGARKPPAGRTAAVRGTQSPSH